jgi:hypothetical protein
VVVGPLDAAVESPGDITDGRRVAVVVHVLVDELEHLALLVGYPLSHNIIILNSCDVSSVLWSYFR